jgi:hypothetical protein
MEHANKYIKKYIHTHIHTFRGSITASQKSGMWKNHKYTKYTEVLQSKMLQIFYKSVQV